MGAATYASPSDGQWPWRHDPAENCRLRCYVLRARLARNAVPVVRWWRSLAVMCAVLSRTSWAKSSSESPPAQGVAASSRPAQDSRIEREIRISLQKHLSISVTADCEDPGRWRAGKTFDCVVYNSRWTTKMPVTMKKDHTLGWSLRRAGRLALPLPPASIRATVTV